LGLITIQKDSSSQGISMKFLDCWKDVVFSKIYTTYRNESSQSKNMPISLFTLGPGNIEINNQNSLLMKR
jgi:hypothetical protein